MAADSRIVGVVQQAVSGSAHGGTIVRLRGFSPAALSRLRCEEGGLLHSCRLRFLPGGCKYRGTQELS